EFGSAILNAIGRLYSAPTEPAFLAESQGLSTMFDRLEIELAAGRTGPWFAGQRFSLVDAVYGPIFRYFDAFDRIDDFGILNGKSLVEAWRKELRERKSVKDAVAPDYPQRLHAFLQAKGSHLSKLIRRNEAATAIP
ncbi:MAG: glutathione S-transferase family protein, partial [Mesorhizobium sp.]